MTALAGGCRIRLARPDDLAALLHLEQLFPSDQMTRRAWQRFIKAPTATCLVVEERSAPTAPATLLGNLLLLTRSGSGKARVYSVIVDPAARGRGLGEALVAAAEKAAAKRGCKAVSLEVRSDNPAALALYAKRGYRQTQALKRYYSDGADGVRLVKPL